MIRSVADEPPGMVIVSRRIGLACPSINGGFNARSVELYCSARLTI